MNYANVANQIMSKGGPALRKAGEHLGAFLLRPQGPAQRIARDTLAYTAAEQGVPRLLGVQAPPIQETLIRQAGGNIVAEGVTAGLSKAFPETGAMIGYKKGGEQHFRPSGITPRLARGIGEFTGQAAGKYLAENVLPGRQQYPFLNTPEGYTKHDWDMQTHSFVPESVEQRVEHGGTLSAERPGHPVSPTGAIPASYEPESAQVQRRDSHDLLYQKQLDAQLDREHYLNRIALAHAQNQPRTITQRVEQDPQKSAMSALHEGYKVQRYG